MRRTLTYGLALAATIAVVCACILLPPLWVDAQDTKYLGEIYWDNGQVQTYQYIGSTLNKATMLDQWLSGSPQIRASVREGAPDPQKALEGLKSIMEAPGETLKASTVTLEYTTYPSAVQLYVYTGLRSAYYVDAQSGKVLRFRAAPPAWLDNIEDLDVLAGQYAEYLELGQISPNAQSQVEGNTFMALAYSAQRKGMDVVLTYTVDTLYVKLVGSTA